MKAYIAERGGVVMPETFRLWRHETIRELERIEGKRWDRLRAENRGRSRYRVVRLEVREAITDPIGGTR